MCSPAPNRLSLLHEGADAAIVISEGGDERLHSRRLRRAGCGDRIAATARHQRAGGPAPSPDSPPPADGLSVQRPTKVDRHAEASLDVTVAGDVEYEILV